MDFLFMFHLNRKYHPWGLINHMQMSIYNRKHWHALSHSLHFVGHEGRLATHPPFPASKVGFQITCIRFSLSWACSRSDWFLILYYNVMNDNTQGWILYNFTPGMNFNISKVLYYRLSLGNTKAKVLMSCWPGVVITPTLWSSSWMLLIAWLACGWR